MMNFKQTSKGHFKGRVIKNEQSRKIKSDDKKGGKEASFVQYSNMIK